jgi:hypothetical protein
MIDQRNDNQFFAGLGSVVITSLLLLGCGDDSNNDRGEEETADGSETATSGTLTNETGTASNSGDGDGERSGE